MQWFHLAEILAAGEWRSAASPLQCERALVLAGSALSIMLCALVIWTRADWNATPCLKLQSIQIMRNGSIDSHVNLAIDIDIAAG